MAFVHPENIRKGRDTHNWTSILVFWAQNQNAMDEEPCAFQPKLASSDAFERKGVILSHISSVAAYIQVQKSLKSFIIEASSGVFGFFQQKLQYCAW